jgi:uncharacterized spore protein YtfJ
MTDQKPNTAQSLADSLNAVFGEAKPSTVFSEPETVGDEVVVMAAAWERAGGFGFGSGYGSVDGEDGGGEGGGGGGASQGRPVAVIRIGNDGVSVVPVVDFTKMGVTVLLAVIGVLGARRKSGD